ncbi:MAG: DinB family protein [Acidobacteria bacterium]|nr:DinB family protein [Acidobacteriota bacterium]
MNYYGAKELAESFRTVRKNTLIIAEEIPEEKYGFSAAAETRSVSRLLAHIAASPAFQYQIHGVERRTTLEGFDFPSIMERLAKEEQQSRSKSEIVEMLRREGDRLAGWLAGLPEDFLGERVTMPSGMTPASKSRFEMLLSIKEHEMHHRAQLILIERMLGIVPHLTREMQAHMAQRAATGGVPSQK